ncbi:hypothetical protein SS50377_23914 [Spironucleus salmonicida]|uniref:Leucine rich repeats-containing protein n=1 Tax=Spironucleus salmonicida TaxID=348837 RepID=V6M4N5_9EUKA|nr:hypothetical protein SS50377_23914 [Spironucleus salmonicida]|eukprot:EST48309.1 Hypothetical protein SS50377_11510 [Spironucleus salmonicida]
MEIQFPNEISQNLLLDQLSWRPGAVATPIITPNFVTKIDLHRVNLHFPLHLQLIQSARNVRDLSLRACNLRVLELRNFEFLTKIDLSNNPNLIRFSIPSSAKVLIVRNCGLTDFSIETDGLNCLDLAHNKLRRVAPQRRLGLLDLSFNSLQNFDVSEHFEVAKVVLWRNELRYFMLFDDVEIDLCSQKLEWEIVQYKGIIIDIIKKFGVVEKRKGMPQNLVRCEMLRRLYRGFGIVRQ